MERGAYEAELVVYATTELQEIFSASRAEQSVSLDDTLLYLTYLLDGSLQEPAQVDFCQRVLPAIRQSFSVLDQQAFGEDLSERQQNLLARINGGYEQAQEEFQNDPACQPPPTASPAQQVST